jgi:hypothetical protein
MKVHVAHRDLLLYGSRAHEDVIPLLLSSHISAQRTTHDRLRTWRTLHGIRTCVHDHVYLQLYADILYLGELGRRTHRKMHQFPHIRLGPCRHQHHTRPSNHRRPNTRAFETLNEPEEKDSNHHDVQHRILVSPSRSNLFLASHR